LINPITSAFGPYVQSVAANPTTQLSILQPGVYFSLWSWFGSSIGAAPQLTLGANITEAPNGLDNNATAVTYVSSTSYAIYETYLTVSTATVTASSNIVTIGGLNSMTSGNFDLLLFYLGPTAVD
jgi:hypothetical protein